MGGIGKARKLNFKVQPQHWDIILEYFEHNPELAQGKCVSKPKSKEDYRQRWTELTMKLNSLGLGEKTVEKWQKTWTDYKCSLKKKVIDIERSRVNIEDTKPCPAKLNELEERFLLLLGDGFYQGSNIIEEVIIEETPFKIEPCTSSSSSTNRKRFIRVDQVYDDHDYVPLTVGPSKRQKNEEEDVNDRQLILLAEIKNSIDCLRHDICINLKKIADAINSKK